MTVDQDKDDLLVALYEMGQASGKRPSIVQAQMSYFPDWDRERLWDAAQALETDGVIMNAVGMMGYVDLTSVGRKKALARVTPPPAQTINIGSVHNSPIQQVGPGGHGVQNTYYELNRADLESVVELYRLHVDELGLDAATRRRADAQVATIQAQLLDEPDPTIVKSAGRSLKTIVEGAIGGALGNAIANPGVWTPLLTLFS
jgi:hypothetical protein